MAAIAKSVATLRIFGDELDPDEVSALLGGQPTSKFRKGDVRRLQDGREFVRRSGSWQLEATDRAPEGLNDQILEILSKLTIELSVWKRLNAEFQVDLFVGLFMEETNEGLSLSPECAGELASRGIEIGFDIYATVREVTPDES
ncbi:MAG: DUF4279 domain-containing protein [Leptothrix ochracea]|uniref:DUF4279 domain-containing protein n=1 Tax=Leptothrix ochracea TaxID=735331 RepID=UPI0034E28955